MLSLGMRLKQLFSSSESKREGQISTHHTKIYQHYHMNQTMNTTEFIYLYIHT